jgi:hypothetical protein
MEECVALVMAELRRRGVLNSHTLAYQSRVGPVEWLQPYTDDSIRELAARGVAGLLAVPISFVSEHIETLEEIDCEYRCEHGLLLLLPGWSVTGGCGRAHLKGEGACNLTAKRPAALGRRRMGDPWERRRAHVLAGRCANGKCALQGPRHRPPARLRTLYRP